MEEVRADEVRVGDHVGSETGELVVLRVRDAADGELVFTLRPAMGGTTELKVKPWATLEVIEH